MDSLSPGSHDLREGGSGDRSAELGRSLAAAVARVDALMREAQALADRICDDAEREAAHLLAERRREGTALLARQRELIAGVFTDLRGDLEAAEHRASTAIEAAMSSMQASRSGGESVATPPPAAGPSMAMAPGLDGGEGRRAERGQERARALIRVAQLAAMGHERAAIEAVLRDEFGLEQPSEVVDQVLSG